MKKQGIILFALLFFSVCAFSAVKSKYYDYNDTDYALSKLAALGPINITVFGLLCDDNGTPFDPIDDLFFIEVIVTGPTGSSWVANDPNATTGLYDVQVSIGPFLIANGNLNLTITDINDPLCSSLLIVQPPPACSQSCIVDHALSNVVCYDNGTTSDPYDDTFSFDVLPTNNANPLGSWIANDINMTTGVYDQVTTFGPYQVTGFNTYLSIYDNDDPSCQTNVNLLSIAESCGVNTLEYEVFYDYNGDGIQDPNEPFYFNSSIFVTEINQYSYFLPNATNSILLPSGTYNISVGNIVPNAVVTTPTNVEVVLGTNNTSAIVSFGILPEASYVLDSYVLNSNLGCNRTAQLEILAINSGTRLVSEGFLFVELDSMIPVANFITAPDTIVSQYKVGWKFVDLQANASMARDIVLDIPGPPTIALGTAFSFKTSIEGLDNNGQILNGSDDEWIYNLACSYDPNDKRVSPAHPLGYTDIEIDELVYTIRFQNTGNAPASQVVLTDLISDHLDIGSFKYISGSHTSDLLIRSRENRLVEFRFDNIILPDSISDPLGSQGYVMFSFELENGLPEGTEVLNEASIYFDTNPAIITNTTVSILYYDMDEDDFFSIDDCDDTNPDINPAAEEVLNNDIDEDCDGEVNTSSTKDITDNGFNLFPNPVSGILYTDRPFEGIAIFRAIDGKVALQSYMHNSQLDVSAVTPGFYIVELHNTDTKEVYLERIVIE